MTPPFIEPEELACVAAHLERLPGPITELISCDERRWLLQWKDCSLLIDLYPRLVSVAIVPPGGLSLYKRPALFVVPHSCPLSWIEALKGQTLKQAWAGLDLCLHLLLDQGELILSLNPYHPNLYWQDSCGTQSLWPYPQLDALSNRASPSSTLPDLLKRWQDAQSNLVRELTLKPIHDFYRLQLKKARRELLRVQAKLNKIEDPLQLIHRGQLLQAYRHLYQKADQQLEVWDWQSHCLITIPLSQLPLQRQIEGLFQKAKGVRTYRRRLEQREQCWQEQIANLQTRYECDLHRGPLQLPQQTASPERAFLLKGYRTFYQGAALILVGRNSHENMKLSFQVAHGSDLWLHVKDYPGSHLLIKGWAQHRSDSLLRAAALLAHHYSKARGKSPVEVSYTEAKWLRKVAGAKAGTVALTQSRCYLSRYDEQLLRGYLSTRSIDATP